MTQEPELARANARRRRRRVRRIAFAVIAIVILVPILAVAVFVARFDPNAYKPEIERAVDQSLGRQLALNGPLSLALSLTPTISAEDVALANPPGFSRPEMATLKRLDAQLSLLPLLSGRLAIRRIVLVQPVIAVEINRAGETNLSFAGQAPSGSAPPSPPPAPAIANSAQGGSKGRPVAIDVRAIRITDGKLSWQDDRTGRHGTLALASFTATTASNTAPMKLAAEANYAGLPFTLRGQTGPLARLAGSNPGSGAGPGGPPWPVQLAFTLGTAQLSLDGTVADPAALRGYQFRLQAGLPALEALSPLFPGQKLPALHDVKLAANLTDSRADSGTTPRAALPALSDVSLEAGNSDLGTLMPGLALSDLSFTAPALDQPCKLMLTGKVGATPFSVAATLGPPAALLPAGFGPPPPATPWPVAFQAAGAGANLAISGSVAQPRSLAGASLAVSAQVPDLAALSPLVARKLPPLAQVSFSGQITDAETGWRQWVRLSDFALTLPQGDLSGDATLALAGARPALTATLTSKRLDLDALRAAMKPAAPGPAPAATAPPAPPPVPPPVPSSSRGPPPVRLIPDTPLPFAALKAADADLTLSVGGLTTGGITYGNLAGKLLLKDGSLTLAPFGVQAPGGHVALTAAVNAAPQNPPVSLAIDAPALALSPLLKAFGLPAEASGTVQLQAHLSGAGDTPHAIASRLDGSLGVAMAGGSVNNDVIRSLLGAVLRAAEVPPALLGSGQSEVRCFAARFDSTNGFVDLRAFLLETGRLTVTGGGGLALGQETLSLHLEPSYQYGSGAISLPVRVNGTFLGPKIAPDVGGAVSGATKPNGLLAEILGALHGGSANNVPDCGPALALARFGATGPAVPPPPSPPEAGGKQSAPNNPLNLLRGLFHQ